MVLFMNRKTWNALKFMVVFAWKYKKVYLFFLGLEQIFYLLFGLVNTVFPGLVLNAIFEQNDSLYFFQIVLLYCGLFFLLKSGAQYIRTLIYGCSYELSIRFSTYIGEITTKIDFRYLEDESVMNLHDKAINCVYNGGFFGPLEKMFLLIREILMIVSVVFILVNLNVFLIIICLTIICLNFFVNHIVNKKIYDLETTKVKTERKKRYLLSVFEDFNFGKEIRTNNLFLFLKNKLCECFLEIYNINRKIDLTLSQYGKFENTTTVIQKIGIYILLAIEVIKRGLKIGDFTLYFNAINQFSNSINTLLKGYLSLSKMGLYIGDLEKFVSLPRMDDSNAKKKIEISSDFCIEFVNVSFKYPGSDIYALKNINLKIKSGDRLAIVGSNGAGKTTLIKLLLRLYTPTNGKILFNGQDIRKFRYDEYAKIFSVVFQDYKLFAFSILENISLSEAYSDDKVKNAIEKSGLREKINKLPLKEKTPLFKSYNDNGVEFSGGEAQKLVIARALYKDSHIVILDEPTAALDPMAEYEIYQRFDTLVKDKTSLYISHRLASTRFSNNIIVLNNGEIVEKGKHIELMENNGLYAEMYNMQAEYYNTSQDGTVYE